MGKWESWFCFSTFPSRRSRSCGNVGISPAFGEIPKELWKEGKACFWLSTLSIAPSFPQLSLCSVYELALDSRIAFQTGSAGLCQKLSIHLLLPPAFGPFGERAPASFVEAVT